MPETPEAALYTQEEAALLRDLDAAHAKRAEWTAGMHPIALWAWRRHAEHVDREREAYIAAVTAKAAAGKEHE